MRKIVAEHGEEIYNDASRLSGLIADLYVSDPRCKILALAAREGVPAKLYSLKQQKFSDSADIEIRISRILNDFTATYSMDRKVGREIVHCFADALFGDLAVNAVSSPLPVKERGPIVDLEYPDGLNIVGLKAGDLEKRFGESGSQARDIRKLVIEGEMVDTDFKFIREHMKLLKSIDISAVSLPSVSLPSQTLCNEAFSRMEELADVKLPADLKLLNGYTFAFCSGLRSIELPDTLQDIGERAFLHCGSLSSIKLPKGLLKIPNGVFVGCRSLFHIELPNTVDEIGPNAFQACVNLALKSLPTELCVLGLRAFGDCKRLSLRFIPDNCMINPYAFEGCDATTLVTYHQWRSRQQ
jgi:hypothetical protein